MDFLKKDKKSDELAFGSDTPAAPKKVDDAPPEPMQSADPFSDAPTDHGEFMPPEPQGKDPFAQDNQGPVQEQPQETPQAEPRDPLEPPADRVPVETTADDKPETQPKLSLPDLPELSDDIMQKSVGAKATPDEVRNTAEPVEEFTREPERPIQPEAEPPMAAAPITPDPNKEPPTAQEPATDDETQEDTQEPLPALEEEPTKPAPQTPDAYPDEPDAEYLPEDTEPESDEKYVEAHAFYDLLQDIKLIKKEIRERDADMRAWEEIDDKLDKKSGGILGNIDTLQEDLIKIDTTLFEEN